MNTPVQENVTETPKKGGGLVTAGFILAIVGAIFAWIPIVNFLTWILAPLALVFCIIGLIKKQKKGLAITGIILAGVAIACYYISWSIAAHAAANALMNM